MTTRPVSDDLWTTTDDGPALVGGRCTSCGTTTFPRQQACPRCTAVGSEDRVLPRRGRLWSHTVQAFPPKAPYLGPTGADFVPYGVGYVDLAEVIVEARLTTTEHLQVDMPVELVLEPFARDPDGTKVVTFAFAPAVAS
jgi:uncharacterized OB-fold protein